MDITILRHDIFKVSSWTGGTTTQLFIYPPDAEYNKIDFDFRLSVATVTIEESIFTALPGVVRKLLVLNGNITLIHENQYSKELSQFEVDTFQGDWKTSSMGTCTDFNLMTSGNRFSKLLAKNIPENTDIKYARNARIEWLFLYLYSGEISLEGDGITYHLTPSDLCLVRGSSPSFISIKGIKPSEMVFVEIGPKQV